jgi:hypothetical protein
MRKRVTFLPGVNCEFYKRGRCFYEERLNPGLHRDWRCQVLLYLEGEYDRLLNQADAFNLDMPTATRIWEGRFRRIVRGVKPCGEYEPGHVRDPAGGPMEDEESAVVDCLHGWLGLCLLRLPLCEGVCRLFRPRPQDDPAAEQH